MGNTVVAVGAVGFAVDGAFGFAAVIDAGLFGRTRGCDVLIAAEDLNFRE